ncbi:MAG TPA: 6-phosphofructokinase [Clostridiales bacterium]|nr:6-phosphofructokinase [Clostridiales bacterium]
MKKIAILTSGGDAPGMNACIRACVRSALNKGLEVYGVDRGYKGLVENNLFPMSTNSVCDIIHRGGTILKTARCLEFKDPATRKIAADNLKKLGIEGLVVIGGDGSFTGAKALSDEQGINVVGIPGTIDNDLAYTDYTLGFDTAVNTVLWAINALRDTMTSHDRVCLVKVMGRHCGDIALYSGICGGAEYILVPEVPYDIQKIAEGIKENKAHGKTASVIVLAEGAGNENEIKTVVSVISGSDVKITTLGHIQRGGSPTMADRMLAAKFGVKAIDLLISGKTDKVVGIRGQKVFDMDITEALSKKKTIDKELYDMASYLC